MFISWKISAVFLTLLTCTGVISYPHVRIPAHHEHPFRANVNTYSGLT